MSLYSYFRISKPSEGKVPAERVDEEYKRLRTRTFWGVTAAYTLYYVCRMTLGVVKQPIIDGGVLTAGELGVIGSVFYFVYAAGKFSNGFIADYCNIRRFMAWGLGISAVINLVLGILGLLQGPLGIGSVAMLVAFALLWGVNGWVQSMGSPPGTISLSRWFPLKSRGTMYSIFSSTPSFGKALTMIALGFVVAVAGWQWGFVAAAAAGVIGTIVAAVFISDTPESKGLPTVQELSGEPLKTLDKKPTKELQKWVFKHPGIWVIAISSAFIYITQHAVSDWGVLFLQKQKEFSLESATQIIGISEAFGVVGRDLLDEHRVHRPVQHGLQRGVLHRRRPDGPGLRPAQGHRRRPGHRGNLQLCRSRSPEHRLRLPHRGQRGRRRLQLRPRVHLLDHRLPDRLRPPGHRVEVFEGKGVILIFSPNTGRRIRPGTGPIPCRR